MTKLEIEIERALLKKIVKKTISRIKELQKQLEIEKKKEVKWDIILIVDHFTRMQLQELKLLFLN
jgi:hypothetical protein